MTKSLRRLFRDKEGATAVEYGIMVAAIAAVIIGTVFTVGTEVDVAFKKVLTEMQGAAAEPPAEPPAEGG